MSNKKYKHKKSITQNEMCSLIKPGSRIFISSGPATPIKSIQSILQSDKKNLSDLEIIQLVTVGDYFPDNPRMHSKYRLKTFNVGESISSQVKEGKVDFIPSHIAEIPFLFASNAVGIDIAIIQTSPPDSRGFINLGIVMDISDLVIKNAPVVIAEINPAVPVTCGHTSIHIDQVDYIVESDLPLLEAEPAPYDEATDRIGWHISNLIANGSTVSLHMGQLFDAVASHLTGKKDLRVYTHVFSDNVIDLIESGSIAMDRGMNHQGAITATSCYGTKRLYDYVNRNPFFEFVPLLRGTYQSAIPKIQKLIGIINVKKIDTTGDSVVLSSGDFHLSGFDGKLNISVGAAQSRNGKAIVAVRSVDRNGNSNIVVSHTDKPEYIRSTQGSTQYVVTEFGIANIIGKSIRERTLAIIDIAHPDHREKLLNEAKAAGYLYPDQIYLTETAKNYPFSLETVKTFRDKLEIKFRPIRPSDEDMMRRLFYQVSDESKYMRYFAPIRTMTHHDMQPYVNIDYNRTLSIIGLIHDIRTERIIAEARYSYSEINDNYEMAFIVDENLQERGIASFMLNYLLTIASERGIGPLTAYVLQGNFKMSSVFEHADIKPVISEEEDEIQYTFNLK